MIGASDPEPALGELDNLVHEIEGADVGTIEADMTRNRRSSNLQLEEGPPMTSASSPRPVSALRARMIEVMTVRGFTEETHSNYIRGVRAFAACIRRPPDTAMRRICAASS